MKLRLTLLSCVVSLVAYAADVTGKWTYEMQGRNGAMTGTMNLKAEGDKVTGTVSGRGGETEISDGKISGDTVSFTVVREFNGNKFTMKYTGTVSDDGIKFKVEREGSDRPPQEFTAKKASST
jgi:hypothetical protein